MRRKGPIMIIEDDRDDQELLEETFSILDYPNPVIFFSNGADAVEYLLGTDTPPVLIISDINMPKMNGLETRERIISDKQLQRLQIPFVFLTTAAPKATVLDAFALSDQGFFLKPNTIHELQNIIKTIVEYWLGSYTPTLFHKQIDREVAA